MLGLVGWILLLVGVASIVLGLVAGAKDVFARSNEPGAQALLPTELLKVLLALLEAPPPKFFFVGGLILVLIGLGLLGVEVLPATGTT